MGELITQLGLIPTSIDSWTIAREKESGNSGSDKYRVSRPVIVSVL